MLQGGGLQLELDRFMMLFSPAFYRTTVLMLYVCFASNFAYYGMIYGLPDTLKEAAVEAESQGAEEYDSHGRGWSPAAGVFLGAMSEIPGVCLAIVLGMTVGRRKNMCFAFSMCALFLVGVAHCISTGQLVHNVGMVAVLGVKLFLATAYIVVYLYLLECYPTTCRATGLATCMVFGRFGAACVPFLYDGARLAGVENVGLWFFITMSAVVFAASVCTCMLPFETKDAELAPPSGRPYAPTRRGGWRRELRYYQARLQQRRMTTGRLWSRRECSASGTRVHGDSRPAPPADHVAALLRQRLRHRPRLLLCAECGALGSVGSLAAPNDVTTPNRSPAARGPERTRCARRTFLATR